MTGTVDSLPLIASSVMSKKLAEGSDALVLDVKCGRGAFMKRVADARALARSMVSIGTAAGVRTECLITQMDVPLGHAVGNALEIAECVQVLRGQGPADLADLVVRLGTRMVRLAEKAATDEDAAALVRDTLASGAALARFRLLVERQGGDPTVVDDPGRLPSASLSHVVSAARGGFVTALDALLVGRAAVALGAGRDKKDDQVDSTAGIRLLKKPLDSVTAGEPVMELRYNEASRLPAALALVRQALVIGDQPPAVPPLVLGWVHDRGETMFVANA